MSNYIEKHPAYSIVTTAILAVTGTWLLLKFVINDNETNLHKAQIENLRAEISHHQARINYLEKENKVLTEQKNLYLDWISKSENPQLFYQQKMEELIEENNDLKGIQIIPVVSATPQNQINKEEPKEEPKKYRNTRSVDLYTSFIDNYTGVMIGVTKIDPDRKATINITFPKEEMKTETVQAGKNYSFTVQNINYKLMIEKIDYISSYVKILLIED